MITENRKTGNLGEDIASRFLLKKGYTMLERNYWKKWGEIDIIAIKDDIIHFIEVKSVSCETIPGVSSETDDKHRPEDNVHPEKLRRLSRVIQTYIIERGVSPETWQFNVVTVYINKKDLISKVIIIENVIL